LIERIKAFSAKYDVQVYLEPGEAVAIGTGVLVAEVLDITWNQVDQAILDISATCHMPDTLEMPYRPDISGSGEAGELAHTYRLGGLTCLAGDVISDYSFAEPLQIGQRLIFEDMAHYTMVKTTTFNGTRLPALVIWNSNTNNFKTIREFGYLDFKQRLS
jgi:carboxynorspermidine decarboxylase